MNIKSKRAVELVRALAARTGSSQTAAVEDAVARRLAELDREETARADMRGESADEILRAVHVMLTDEDKRAIRRAEAELYDEDGVPR